MIKIGMIGLGFMGHTHLDNYIRLESEGYPIKVVAICDIDESKFEGKAVVGNIAVGTGEYDFSKYNIYTDIDEMLEKEDLDYLDTALPSYLHAQVAIKGLSKGLNVFSEKPMALKSEDCQKMIDAAKENNKLLQIGQCLRFWPEYEYLKECVEDERYGKVVSGYFYRGGGTPTWSYKNWLFDKEKSGGALFDQHIHDVDTINWLFGAPTSVSTIAKNMIKGNGYDIVSTNYVYDDEKVINSQDDWTLNGDYGFEMTYRVNFEKGNLVLEKGVLKVNPNDGKSFTPDLDKDTGYYREQKYYLDCILNNKTLDRIDPKTTMKTIKIAESEQASADERGAFKEVK